MKCAFNYRENFIYYLKLNPKYTLSLNQIAINFISDASDTEAISVNENAIDRSSSG